MSLIRPRIPASSCDHHAGPLGMLRGLPAQVEHAVAVLGDVVGIVYFSADCDQDISRWDRAIRVPFAASANLML